MGREPGKSEGVVLLGTAWSPPGFDVLPTQYIQSGTASYRVAVVRGNAPRREPSGWFWINDYLILQAAGWIAFHLRLTPRTWRADVWTLSSDRRKATLTSSTRSASRSEAVRAANALAAELSRRGRELS
jgi:hypothetical protein